MCFNKKYKYRTLHGGLLDNKEAKAEAKNKYSLKDCSEQFFNFSYKNIINDIKILFDAALLVQKNTMRAGYAERSIK